VSLPLILAGVEVERVALISPNVEVIILGLDWMSKYNVQLNFGGSYYN